MSKTYKNIILSVVWSLTPREKTQIEGVREQGTEENIQTQEGGSKRRLEKTE
jgi:hypothetical protein